MKMRVKVEGRRFSRRLVKEFTAGGETLRADVLDTRDMWMPDTIAHHKGRAVRLLEASGIDASRLLADDPSGSALSDRVLNVDGHELYSNEGIAARIVMICQHIECARQRQFAPDEISKDDALIADAFVLGRLTALLDVYIHDSADHANRRTGKPTNNPDDTNRNQRLRNFHTRWVAENGQRGAKTETAKEFGLSTKQVGRILNAEENKKT